VLKAILDKKCFSRPGKNWLLVLLKYKPNGALMKDKKTTAHNNHPHISFPIVAIGASAGGLEAVTQLIKNLPPATRHVFYLRSAFKPRL